MSLQPIREPSQLKKKLVWEPLSAERASHPMFWWELPEDQALATATNDSDRREMRKLLRLRARLLSFGGNLTCLPELEEDYDAIMTRGQLFVTRPHMRKGRPSQCHANSCLLWEANRGHCNIATGYALSEDGIWRQHSWVIQKMPRSYRVWETTTPRIAYFGFIMADNEAEEFYYNNV